MQGPWGRNRISFLLAGIWDAIASTLIRSEVERSPEPGFNLYLSVDEQFAKGGECNTKRCCIIKHIRTWGCSAAEWCQGTMGIYWLELMRDGPALVINLPRGSRATVASAQSSFGGQFPALLTRCHPRFMGTVK
jgi:hypothetical protein